MMKKLLIFLILCWYGCHPKQDNPIGLIDHQSVQSDSAVNELNQETPCAILISEDSITFSQLISKGTFQTTSTVLGKKMNEFFLMDTGEVGMYYLLVPEFEQQMEIPYFGKLFIQKSERGQWKYSDQNQQFKALVVYDDRLINKLGIGKTPFQFIGHQLDYQSNDVGIYSFVHCTKFTFIFRLNDQRKVSAYSIAIIDRDDSISVYLLDELFK